MQTTYCYNPKVNAITAWPGIAFSRIWRLGNKYYGFNVDGVYELTGALDATVPVTSRIKLSETDFGTFALKRLHYMRIDADGDVNKPLTITTKFDGNVESSISNNQFNAAMRCKLGRGAKGRMVSIKIDCSSPNFALRSIELYPTDLQRGVR